MDNELKWKCHVDYIIKKACKKLYSLSVLRRARVSQPNILRIYLNTVRPVLEYAVPVWQNIPAYLSEAIERVQKRALNIIYPEAESYAHALQLGKLNRLDDGRVLLYYKYMAKTCEVPSDEMTILFIQITDNFPYKTDRLLKLEILSETL